MLRLLDGVEAHEGLLSESTTSAPSTNNVIVTVFLCLLVFVFIKLRPVRAVLLDVAPLAAPVTDVLFI